MATPGEVVRRKVVVAPPCLGEGPGRDRTVVLVRLQYDGGRANIARSAANAHSVPGLYRTAASYYQIAPDSKDKQLRTLQIPRPTCMGH